MVVGQDKLDVPLLLYEFLTQFSVPLFATSLSSRRTVVAAVYSFPISKIVPFG